MEKPDEFLWRELSDIVSIINMPLLCVLARFRQRGILLSEDNGTYRLSPIISQENWQTHEDYNNARNELMPYASDLVTALKMLWEKYGHVKINWPSLDEKLNIRGWIKFRSEALDEIIIAAKDEDWAQWLRENEPDTVVYTITELKTLLEIKPLLSAEKLRIAHQIKKASGGIVVDYLEVS